jgi:predicted RND superfamily exporter protein
MVVGFVNDALPKILTLFALSVLITVFILHRCFRFLRLACLPLFSGGLSVLWSLGISSLMGTRMDPMTTIVPFLVFSIGVSHGIQMVKRYLEECSFHPEGYNAALHALAGLMVPGMVALTTDAIGFLTIYIVPIGVVRDVALSASIGVACIIVANGLALTLILSYFPNLLSSEEIKPAPEQIKPYLSRILTGISHLTYGRNAYRVTAVAFVLLLIGFFHARTVTVGDVNPGEPLSRYQRRVLLPIFRVCCATDPG